MRVNVRCHESTLGLELYGSETISSLLRAQRDNLQSLIFRWATPLRGFREYEETGNGFVGRSWEQSSA